MFLFIFESIGTSELIVVGIIALVVLGPRRLPDLARKFGKITAEFRGTANEFKETWQREVNFEEESKALDINSLEAESVKRADTKVKAPTEPMVKEIDPASFEHFVPTETPQVHATDELKTPEEKTKAVENSKETWL